MTGLNDFRNHPEPRIPRCLCGHFFEDHPDDVCRLCRHVCVYRPDKPIQSPSRACDATTSAAAPLSTLPERPASEEELEYIARWADKNWLTSATHRAAEEIRSLRSRLSSLERELDGVRKERDATIHYPPRDGRDFHCPATRTHIHAAQREGQSLKYKDATRLAAVCHFCGLPIRRSSTGSRHWWTEVAPSALRERSE